VVSSRPHHWMFFDKRQHLNRNSLGYGKCRCRL